MGYIFNQRCPIFGAQFQTQGERTSWSKVQYKYLCVLRQSYSNRPPKKKMMDL